MSLNLGIHITTLSSPNRTMASSYKTRLNFDPDQACKLLAQKDPVLAGIMQQAGPYQPSTSAAPDSFHALLRAITYQQLSGHAAQAIHGRVLNYLGAGSAPGPKRVAQADPEALRKCGLSKTKIATIQGLAQAILQGQIPDEKAIQSLDNETLIDTLSALRGIGRWTVQMLLMFQLGRADVMPSGDLGVRKGYAIAYGLANRPTPKQLESLCAPWQPYRSVGSWYMWRAVELAGASGQPR